MNPLDKTRYENLLAIAEAEGDFPRILRLRKWLAPEKSGGEVLGTVTADEAEGAGPTTTQA